MFKVKLTKSALACCEMCNIFINIMKKKEKLVAVKTIRSRHHVLITGKIIDTVPVV